MARSWPTGRGSRCRSSTRAEAHSAVGLVTVPPDFGRGSTRARCAVPSSAARPRQVEVAARHAHPRPFRLCRPIAVRPFSGYPSGAGPRARSRHGPRGGSAPHTSTRLLRPCLASPSTAARIANRAGSSAACARTRAPGSGMCSSTSPSNCRISLARRSRSARPVAPDQPGVYTVVYEYAQRDEGIAAGELGAAAAVFAAAARAFARRTPCPTDWSWPEARDEFIRFAQRRALGPSTAALVRAAE